MVWKTEQEGNILDQLSFKGGEENIGTYIFEDTINHEGGEYTLSIFLVHSHMLYLCLVHT